MKLSRRFPLNALRVFEVVARHQNFTRAAEELGMTQTAASYQIKLLEDFLGEAVFIRRPRALQLTETGAQLLPKVSDAFTLLSDAVSDARQAVGETLEIRSPPTFASHWLSPRLGAFRAAHPDITVRLVRLIDADEHPVGIPDVVIRIAAGPPEGMISHPLMQLRYSPMISPDLAAGIGGVRQPSDLLSLPWISQIDGTWLDWFAQAKIDPAAIRPTNLNALGAQDLEARAAISGHGVAMLSPFFFRDELASGHLIQPFDLCVGDGKTYWLAYPPARRSARKVQAFASWLGRSIAADLSGEGMGALAHADLAAD